MGKSAVVTVDTLPADLKVGVSLRALKPRLQLQGAEAKQMIEEEITGIHEDDADEEW